MSNQVKANMRIFKDKQGRLYMICFEELLHVKATRNASSQFIAEQTGLPAADVKEYIRYAYELDCADVEVPDVDFIAITKAIGKLFVEDERLFMFDVTRRINRVLDHRIRPLAIQQIYGLMKDVLSELVDSEFYNYRIDTPEKEDGCEHYCERMELIRRLILRQYTGFYPARKSLLDICEEVAGIVTDYGSPDSISDRWFRLNPKLSYFDPVYDIMRDDYALFLQIAANSEEPWDGKTLRFSFVPTMDELWVRELYFEEMEARFGYQNEERTFALAYQYELLRTLDMAFEEIADILGVDVVSGWDERLDLFV